MKGKFALLGLLSFVLVGMAQAQEGWNWPSDPQMEAKAREYNAAYNDYMKADQFIQATKPLHWLLVNAPDLNEAIYINGVTVYDGASKETSDEAQKEVYQDSVMTVYELRGEKYDNTANWIENQAYYAYNYYRGDKEKVGIAADYFAKDIELNGEINTAGLVPAYFDLVYRNYAYNQAYTDQEVLEIYDGLYARLDKAEAEGADVSGQKSTLDKILVNMEIIDCDFIQNKLAPQMEANPDDIALAKRVFQYSVQYKCTSSEAFTKALEIVDNDSPTFSTSQVRGMRAMQSKDYSTAEEMFTKALDLADNDSQRAEVYYDLAKAQAQQGKKSTARQSALKVLEFDSEKTADVWNFIGSLYMGSSNDCRGGQSRVKDYSVFIAAYEAFAKAGNNSGMANAKARFPSKEELFTEGYQEGQSINTGCWVGQSVTLRTRD
ncbi:hypothetical protein DN752_10490 [Echinicola strongylocentroti]|uniref:Uncharacterized protein n=1 Tax=Echinicola strongylocentroti TaxID=1795355 RepID=A0A2Z4IJ13_9BACT|nr:tetratricopeptide repeat protein [Echinicola strongylocentroti]AWW30518.1 hypothetical protein DN752_10490 [Echinicola strongylocentroti]